MILDSEAMCVPGGGGGSRCHKGAGFWDHIGMA